MNEANLILIKAKAKRNLKRPPQYTPLLDRET